MLQIAEQWSTVKVDVEPMSPGLCSQDDDPYVRKTAAVCVAKLFDINPELVEDRGFLDMLRVRRP